MATALRRSIVQTFKLQGLTLQSQATSLLVEVLEPYQDSEDLKQIVDSIVEAVQKQPLTTSLVQRDVRDLQHTPFPTHSPLSSGGRSSCRGSK